MKLMRWRYKNPMTRIVFPYNCDKAIQAILWLLHRNNKAMDKLQLVKLFFYADSSHLIKYGRPIAGGNYYAMEHGPVCSEVLDILDEVEAGSDRFPLNVREPHDIVANASPDTHFLSESDLNVLDEIYQQYGHIDPWKLRNMTHELNSYKKNEPKDKEKRRPLPYEDFFEDYSKAERGMLQVIKDEQEAWADFV